MLCAVASRFFLFVSKLLIKKRLSIYNLITFIIIIAHNCSFDNKGSFYVFFLSNTVANANHNINNKIVIMQVV